MQILLTADDFGWDSDTVLAALRGRFPAAQVEAELAEPGHGRRHSVAQL